MTKHFLTVSELAAISGAHHTTIRRILNNPKRQAAELPGSELVELGGMSIWRIPVDAAMKFKPRPRGRIAEDE